LRPACKHHKMESFLLYPLPLKKPFFPAVSEQSRKKKEKKRKREKRKIEKKKDRKKIIIIIIKVKVIIIIIIFSLTSRKPFPQAR
jgi:hypothetical protein